MAYNRSDIRTRVRDYIYEDTADLISDAKINRLINEEILSLPSKDIYKEDLWEFTTTENDQDYAFESGLKKIEILERNDGTTTIPDWVEINGWKARNSILYLPDLPGSSDSYRAFGKYAFTTLSDDVTNTDVPDDVTEILVWGTVVRAYRIIIGYLRDSRNWDSISKPDGVSLQAVSGYLRDAERQYRELIKQYSTIPEAKEINLVS